MITIRVVCSSCDADLSLSREELHLVISTVARASRYSFTCPECLAWVSKPASPPAVKTLEAYVRTTWEVAPKEIFEVHKGPALTVDDLIEFGLQLHATDLVAALVGR